MARPRSLPPGIRPRGRGYVYDWRDASGKTFCRKAGETIAEALAFKARIDAELAAGTFVAGSKTTFAEYAAHWIETHPLKSQMRRGYRSVLRSDLLPYFGATPLPKITPVMGAGGSPRPTSPSDATASIHVSLPRRPDPCCDRPCGCPGVDVSTVCGSDAPTVGRAGRDLIGA